MNAAERTGRVFPIQTSAKARANHRHAGRVVARPAAARRAKLILLPAARRARRRRETVAAATCLAALLLLAAAAGWIYMSWSNGAPAYGSGAEIELAAGALPVPVLFYSYQAAVPVTGGPR